jgi:hypothetical protein
MMRTIGPLAIMCGRPLDLPVSIPVEALPTGDAALRACA